MKHKWLTAALKILLAAVVAAAPLSAARAATPASNSTNGIYFYNYNWYTAPYWSWHYRWQASPNPGNGQVTRPAPVPAPAPAPQPVPEPKPDPVTPPVNPSVPAPQPAPQPAPAGNYQLSQYEQQVVNLVNAERAKAGLKPLAADSQLARVARLKAEDMRDKNYFSHESPTYGSFASMLKQFGISYRTAGENIAAGYPTPEAVVAAWMNSPGHRSNILNANYTAIGVGYASGGSYGHYWVQEFIGK
ncbi:MAG: hypothetical protein PWP41_955 [Moorella sp. (in: firmicutes)]|nr:hypothetical protein [Moorella sp. (in: firmicutes)]